jgi:glycosyltransferase involved in cell wall biosynthesis
MSLRVALLTEIPAPFRIPLFNALAAEEGLELRVLFLAERDPRRPYYRFPREEARFDYRVLGSRELRPRGRWLLLGGGVGGELRAFRPEALVVGGWNQPAFWQALAYARTRGRPLVTWVESTARDERSGAKPLELAKRALVRASAAAVVPGSAAAAYVRGLGAREAVVAPNAVDATIFGDRVLAGRSTARGSGRCTFLYVGRLDPEKDVSLLLRAAGGVDADVVVIGSGVEEDRLRADAPANVTFLGPLDRDDLVPWYAKADAFVLPSRSEQWGHVLNEAAAAALPLVATEAAGAAHDLIEHGVNGFRIPAGDAAALAEALGRIAGDAEFRRAAGARSRELARRFTAEAWAEAVAELLRRLARQQSERGRP